MQSFYHSAPHFIHLHKINQLNLLFDFISIMKLMIVKGQINKPMRFENLTLIKCLIWIHWKRYNKFDPN